MSRSARLSNKAVTLHDGVAALAAPSGATDGGAITGFRQGKQAPRLVSIAIDADGACTLSSAYLCGYDGSSWRRLATINGGSDVALTATLGWEEKFADIGTFDRLAVTATVSANNVTVAAVPIEVIYG